MRKILILILCFIVNSNILSQELIGKVTDINNNPISGVNISTNAGIGSSTDDNGEYKLKMIKGVHIVNYDHINYEKKSIEITFLGNERLSKTKNLILIQKNYILPDIDILSDSKEENITPSLSIEILNEDFFVEKANTDVSTIISQVSGLTLNDKQVHIRGGSGWNPMAGSRVLFLIDENPMLTGNMGQIPWDLIPMENIEEIEIIKGASSAIYGISALNGVVNIKTKSPNQQLINNNPSLGFTQINSLYGYYDNPKRESLVWSKDKNEIINFDILHSEIIGNTSFFLSGNYFKDDGYRMGQNISRKRISANIKYFPKKIKDLQIGMNGTIMEKDDGIFLLWESFDHGYTPLDSMFYRKNSLLYQLNPYISLTNKKSEHKLSAQILNVSLNFNETNIENDMSSKIYYLDYKYKYNIESISSDIMIGSSYTTTLANAEIFSGTNSSEANSIYILAKKKINNTIFSFGSRYEMIKIKSEESFAYLSEIPTNSFIKKFPIFYAGAEYQIDEKSKIRTYLGQGIRLPSFAEMFVSMGAIEGTYIFPNPELKPETGWSFELAYNTQSLFDNKIWDIDIAYFIMQYNNMMEFGFEQFGTEFDYENAYGLGFKTINVGNTQISGLELDLNTDVVIRDDIKTKIRLGYTYLNPIALHPNEVYETIYIGDSIKTITFLNSSSDTSILKYRYQNLFKIDMKFEYKKYYAGININYNDYMKNIDKFFTTELVNNGIPSLNYDPIIPGINTSRSLNLDGDLQIDILLGIKISPIAKLNLIINNLTNREIYSRPTDIKPPRTFLIKLNLSI